MNIERVPQEKADVLIRLSDVHASMLRDILYVRAGAGDGGNDEVDHCYAQFAKELTRLISGLQQREKLTAELHLRENR